MARIAGVDLPRNKRIEVALTYIYGIGFPTSKKILQEAGVDPDKKANDLTEEEIARLREIIENNYRVEGDLRRGLSEYKETYRPWNLQGIKTQIWATCTGTENQDKCKNKERST